MFCSPTFFLNSLIWISPNTFFTHIHSFSLLCRKKKRNETTKFALSHSLAILSHQSSHALLYILSLSQRIIWFCIKLAHLAIFSFCVFFSLALAPSTDTVFRGIARQSFPFCFVENSFSRFTRILLICSATAAKLMYTLFHYWFRLGFLFCFWLI